MKPSDNRQKILRQIVPPLAGIVLIVLFIRLGFWQLDRAAEKIELQQAFNSSTRFSQVSEDLQPGPFQAIESRGRYLDRQQIIIENVVLDGALGYYVGTPLEYASYGPLLLVNRGWIPRDPSQLELPDITVDGTSRLVRGKTGNLPRVGIRPGNAFLDRDNWPRVGVWPTSEEVAVELDREVLPFVMLLDPDQADGYARRWTPKLAGPSTNYGYAFQWVAMATALVILMGWNFRSRKKSDGS